MNRLSFEKVFYHIDQLYDFIHSGDNYPVHITIGLTSFCNHKCVFCYGDYVTSNAEKNYQINTSRLLAILGDAHKKGLKAVSLVGTGEPLLHRDAAQIIREIKNIGIEVAVYTNGVMIKGDIMDAVLESCTWIRISCNAKDTAEHDYIHGCKNDFNKILSNVEVLLKRRNKMGSRQPTIGCQFAAFQDNYKSIADAARLWKRLGIDYFAIKPVYKHEKNVEHPENLLDYDIIKAVLKKTLSLEDETYNVYAKFEQFKEVLAADSKRSYQRCYSQAFSTALLANGKFYLCGNLHSEEKYCLGNMNEDEFNDIWTSEKRKKVIRSINLAKCPVRCRNDPLNKILWDLKKPDPDIHPNFI